MIQHFTVYKSQLKITDSLSYHFRFSCYVAYTGTYNDGEPGTCTYFVTPGVAPTLQARDLFRLLMILLLPVLGNPERRSQEKHFRNRIPRTLIKSTGTLLGIVNVVIVYLYAIIVRITDYSFNVSI